VGWGETSQKSTQKLHIVSRRSHRNVCQALQYLARISDANNNQIVYVALVLDNKNTLNKSFLFMAYVLRKCV
jgi:hypothetical protein